MHVVTSFGFLFFLTTVYTKVFTYDLEEGSLCDLGSNITGVCHNALKCDYALRLLARGERPIICGFEGLNSIVCCPPSEVEAERITEIKKNDAETTTLTPKHTQNAKILTVPIILPALSISEEQCLELYPPVLGILRPNEGGGGIPAQKDEFKHMAAIGYGVAEDIEWLCGGSLISTRFVLTAAHCLVSSVYGRASWVRLGDVDISDDKNNTAIVDVAVKNIYKHPGYKLPERHHDIGLLELDKEIEITYNIQPACLDTTGVQYSKNLTATGWGRTAFTGDASNVLLKVDLDSVSFEECQKSFKDVNDELQLCAGGGPKKDTCQGDSGGPLQLRDPKQPNFRTVFRIVAITSYGKPCGITKSPGVYTRVYPHLKWIESFVWPTDH